MGITRSNLHKRRVTGAKRNIYRKKRKFELGRVPANTKLGKPKLRQIRVRGGNYKVRAIRLNIGNFAWGSENTARRTRIVNVVYNATNNELVRTNTLVKGCIVQIDATPFRQWYEEWYNQPLGKSKTTFDDSKLTKRQTERVEKRRVDHEVDSLLKDQFPTGKVLARISSSPGQVGRADGYILEGPELTFYLKKLATKKKSKK
jgi:small subunit ribosomal protein S8e